MSAKQDRQGVRTAAELERKYKLGDTDDLMAIANEAKRAAEAARRSVEGITQQRLFDILINGSQGVFISESGELYINASYVAGILASKNGETSFSLDTGKVVWTDTKTGLSLTISGDKVSANDLDEGENKAYPVSWKKVGGVKTLVGGDVSPGKKVLFTGDVAVGSSFTVPDTADYDLFAVRLGDASNTEETVVLAYKVGSKINGVGGWSGTTDTAKELFFLSVEVTDDNWALVNATKQGFDSGGALLDTSMNLKEVIGVI